MTVRLGYWTLYEQIESGTTVAMGRQRYQYDLYDHIKSIVYRWHNSCAELRYWKLWMQDPEADLVKVVDRSIEINTTMLDNLFLDLDRRELRELIRCMRFGVSSTYEKYIPTAKEVSDILNDFRDYLIDTATLPQMRREYVFLHRLLQFYHGQLSKEQITLCRNMLSRYGVLLDVR